MSSKIIIVVVGILFSALVAYIGYDSGMKAGILEGASGGLGAAGAQGRFGAGGFGGAGGNFPTGANNGGAATNGGANNGGNANGGFGNNPAALFAAGLQGTVDKVDGKTLTVTVTRGQQTQQVKVTLADGGTVEQLATGKTADIKVGQRIMIGLAPAANATPGAQASGGGNAQIPSEVTARSITILPATAP